jgi:hypothetical protein
MSQYDNLVTYAVRFPGVNFGAGTTSQLLKVPRKCKLARVLDIFVNGTVLFTQVTTPAIVQIGDGTTPDIFASLVVGALAAGATIGGGDTLNGVHKSFYLAANYNSGAGLHDLTATFVAPTGGSPAGTGDVTIILGVDQIGA